MIGWILIITAVTMIAAIGWILAIWWWISDYFKSRTIGQILAQRDEARAQRDEEKAQNANLYGALKETIAECDSVALQLAEALKPKPRRGGTKKVEARQ